MAGPDAGGEEALASPAVHVCPEHPVRPRGLSEEWRSAGWGEKGRGCQEQKGRMERLPRRRNSPSFSLSQNLPFLPFLDAFPFCVPVHKSPRVSSGPSLNSSFPSITFLMAAAGPRPAPAPPRPAPRWHISPRGAPPQDRIRDPTAPPGGKRRKRSPSASCSPE